MMEPTKKFAVQYIGYTVLTTNDNLMLDGLQKHLLALYQEFVKCGGYYPHRLQQVVMSPVWMKFNNTDSSSRKDAKFLYGAIQVWDAVMLRTFKSGSKKVYGIFESICFDQIVGKEKPKNLFPVKEKLNNPKHASVPFVMFIYMPKPKQTRLELHVFATQGVEHACEIVNTISYSKSAFVEDYGTLKVDDQMFANDKPLDNWRLTGEGWRLTATKNPMTPGSLKKNEKEPPPKIREHDPTIPNFSKQHQYEGRLFSDSAERRRKPDLIKNINDNRNCDSVDRARTIATEVEDKVYNGRLVRSEFDLRHNGRRGSIQSDLSVDSYNEIKVNKMERRQSDMYDNLDSSEKAPGSFAERLAVFKERERTSSSISSDTSSASPRDVSTSPRDVVSFSNREAVENNKAQAESVECSPSNLPQYMRTGIKVLPTVTDAGIALANRNKLKPASPRNSGGSRRNSLELRLKDDNDDDINRRHSMLEPDRFANFNRDDFLTGADILRGKENSNPETDSIASTLSRLSTLSTDDVMDRMSKHATHQRSKKDAEIDATLRAPVQDPNAVENDIEKCLGYLP